MEKSEKVYQVELNEEKSETQKRAEHSIHTTYRSDLWGKFIKGIKNYRLISPGDKIAVCISGGKDSMLLAKLFQELHLYTTIPFDVIYLSMDPGYSPANRQKLSDNAKLLGVPLTIFETDIFESVEGMDKNPCFMCAKMRRGCLYSQAQKLGCNKIALGHHYDDVIETTLMGMLFGAQMQTMMPKLHSDHFEGMELIRPLYLVREEAICRWRDENGLSFLRCACRFTENLEQEQNKETASKRLQVKNLIADLMKTNPYIESNIFKSAENVQLDSLLGYKQNGERHYFLDDYDNR